VGGTMERKKKEKTGIEMNEREIIKEKIKDERKGKEKIN
jgi:hypothetical protein